jgi:cytochrome c oxidase assembly protein subunit 15
METKFRKSVQISLILVYLVIAAGSIVRMTGSGMGCPDWPKCFGYWIPPTERAQLDWKAQHPYQKGQVIILEEILKVAKTDFLSSQAYDPSHWADYTQHDYALFNPYHTWIEYINRLLGAVAGLAVLVMAAFSLGYFRNNKLFPLLSFLIVLGMGFQAWLGKTVVDSNLSPYKISLHMGMALLIVLGLIFLLFSTQKRVQPLSSSFSLRAWTALAVALTLFQIGIGTQVRQYVDVQMHLPPSQWLESMPLKFSFHRSFSLLVLGIHLILFRSLRQSQQNPLAFRLISGLIGLEIITGIVMYYFDFPFSSQPLHLILAALLFGAQSYLILQLFSKRKSYDL